MSITYGKGNRFKNNKMLVYTTFYSDKGDSVTRSLKNAGLNSSNYARRHYVVSGEFGCSYPNSSLPDETGGIIGTTWPFNDFKDVDSFTIISLENSSSYHCFIPIGPYYIDHKTYDLKTNDSFVATKGCVYVSTVDFTINDEIHEAGAILACEDNDATVIMKADGKITAFVAIKTL
jgi:hypothetical protein